MASGSYKVKKKSVAEQQLKNINVICIWCSYEWPYQRSTHCYCYSRLWECVVVPSISRKKKIVSSLRLLLYCMLSTESISHFLSTHFAEPVAGVITLFLVIEIGSLFSFYAVMSKEIVSVEVRKGLQTTLFSGK